MFRDDGYRAPKLVILLVLLVMVATAVYVVGASRAAAQAGSEADVTISSHVRQIDQATEDAAQAAGGQVPKRWRTP